MCKVVQIILKCEISFLLHQYLKCLFSMLTVTSSAWEEQSEYPFNTTATYKLILGRKRGFTQALRPAEQVVPYAVQLSAYQQVGSPFGFTRRCLHHQLLKEHEQGRLRMSKCYTKHVQRSPESCLAPAHLQVSALCFHSQGKMTAKHWQMILLPLPEKMRRYLRVSAATVNSICILVYSRATVFIFYSATTINCC